MTEKIAFGKASGDTNANSVALADATGARWGEHKAVFSQMSGANSSTDWLKGFAITEAAGATAGSALGAGAAYGLGRYVGMGFMGVAADDVLAVTAKCGLFGAGAGLLLAGTGYGLYKGYEWLTKPAAKDSQDA